MNKVFLYLYPIEEYTKMLDLGNEYYDEIGIRRPLDVLNEVIQKRYRDNGYQIVYAIYPDKEIYGILPQSNDKIVYTDITFNKASGYNQDRSEKTLDDIVYPNEQYILEQLGNVDELVIGGYHFQDCCKRVGEVSLANGVNTIIDLDMTDLFFNLYKQEEYFNIDSYDSARFKEYMINKTSRYGDEFSERLFNRNYQSEAYGFEKFNKKQK